jgi:CheY-like chemotaxis protein
MKVLVVDPDLRRAPALEEAMTTGGAEVTIAPSGSFALTMLEWNRHDIVVSRARIDDMEGHELCAILKADPGTRGVRFVLIAAADEVLPAETSAAGVDLVLPASMAGGAILPLLVRLMEAHRASSPDLASTLPAPTAAPSVIPTARPAVAPRLPASPAAPSVPSLTPIPPRPAPSSAAPPVPRIRPTPPPPPATEPPKRYATAVTAGPEQSWAAPSSRPAGAPRTPAAAPSRTGTPAPAASTSPRSPATASGPDQTSVPSGTFQGSLEVMELADLTQAIGAGGKSGRLILALPQGGGLMLFHRGRVVHAEYRNAVGEEAFGALLAACHADAKGRFCFLPSGSGETPGQPRTIDKTVDQLLLSSATAIDEKA